MRVNSITGNRAKLAETRQAVYDGRDRCGDIQQRGAEFIARDRRGAILGTFPTLHEAVRSFGGSAA